MEQCHSDGLQLRSHSFELMKIAVDLEVSIETIEMLRQHWHTAPLFALSKGKNIDLSYSTDACLSTHCYV